MTDDMTCLLDVLRGRKSAADFSPLQLQKALIRAESENVLPYFLLKLRASGQPLCPEIETTFRAAERETLVSLFWWISELKGILRSFTCGAIDVILLKGPCLAERLYGDASMRSCRDLDLLVRQNDLKVAGDILGGLGFDRGEDDEQHQSWRRGTTMIELHFTLASPVDIHIDNGRVFDRALPITYAGESAYILSPPDELLFLCLHGVKHCFDKLSYVVDLALAFEKYGSQVRDEVMSSEHRISSSLICLGYTMAENLQTIDALPKAILRSQAKRRIDRIAKSLWSRITERLEAPNPWRFPRRIYLALQPTRLDQVRYLGSISFVLRDEDRAFARRLHVNDSHFIWLARQARLFGRLFRRGVLQN